MDDPIEDKKPIIEPILPVKILEKEFDEIIESLIQRLDKSSVIASVMRDHAHGNSEINREGYRENMMILVAATREIREKTLWLAEQLARRDHVPILVAEPQVNSSRLCPGCLQNFIDNLSDKMCSICLAKKLEISGTPI